MIIDFHTHIFPDKIAGKTIESLGTLAGVKAATDSPWSDAKAAIEYVRSLPVGEDVKEQILGGNARGLLKTVNEK